MEFSFPTVRNTTSLDLYSYLHAAVPNPIPTCKSLTIKSLTEFKNIKGEHRTSLCTSKRGEIQIV